MIKLGFIGCGGIARYHAATIQREAGDVRILAGADVTEDARKAFGEIAGTAALFPNYQEMLERGDVDAVCVALPTYLHRNAVLEAAAAGKHVFCEKPMARSLSECDEMIDACERAGVILMIGHVRRYDNDWATWKKIVESGDIGRPVVWRQTTGGPAPGAWYMDDKMGGGPFLDGCIHNLEFSNFVFGEPEFASGSLIRLAETSALDTGTVSVHYKSGDVVTLNWSWGLPPGVRTGSMTDIVGPKGAVIFPSSLQDSDYPTGFDKEHHGAYLVRTSGGNRIVEFEKRDMFAEEWKGFHNAITSGKRVEATGEAGRKAVEVALAGIEAGRTHTLVTIGGKR